MNEKEYWNILIVDDTRNNLFILSSILRKKGYRIAAALSGLEAIELLQHKQFDLILLDIRMPGINGIETCKRIKATPETAEIPVLFISAIDDHDLIAEAFAAGGRDYILKPFEPVELIARIETQLDIQRGRRLLEQINAGLEKVVEEKTHELHEKNKALERALAERTILLQEVYHRVNNNLQFVKSLISIDKPEKVCPWTEDFFKRFESRIHSLAYVHELLYRSPNLKEVDMALYSHEIFRAAHESAETSPTDCQLLLHNTPFTLGINHAIPCGMIINELIRTAVSGSAACTHDNDRISIMFSQEGNNFVITLKLEGSLGGKEELVPSGTDLLITTVLAEEQLFGNISIQVDDVTTISVVFPNIELGTFRDVDNL
ncbi:response regulator [Sediminispirochaeta smaragdinae]|uniref:Response regulator receiver protein n=1 Tax=Sediminispirochaeta smaragdinae (strain DSM 11293 / JCM 15392 / SEBR 4228) TaxID=573413 RepID=E1R879_SEDSS|nr:response regulator [Sediminispirochaeta smaragdinae]ADK82934.1 response regulator receiver protein [Sediminispirochaeta smaragdinae DSM 11293]